MPRNRRNTRRRTIKEYLSMKTFLTIVGILTIVIVVCIGVKEYRSYEDRQLLAKQKEELEKQSQQIFSEIEDNINKTNQTISETDEIIKMSAVGDILCGQSMIQDAYDESSNTYDFSHMFNRTSGYINKADIVMGTMETNFANSEYTDKNSPKEFAKAVKDTGINLVTISHNHSLDCGLQGLKETKANLQELGYDVVGDKLDSENAVIIKEVKNTNIAFLTYTYGVNDQDSRSKEELDAISIYSEKQVNADIDYAKNKGAEYIVVMIHWGEAMSDTINSDQEEMTNFLVNSGVDMILGSHAAVVQPMEVRKNKDGENVFIAYSIGTYISDLYDEEAKVELVLNIELRKSGKDGKVYLNKIDYTPIYVLDNGQNTENRYELIDMKSTATNYASGNTGNIDRTTYDKLVAGLKKLEGMLSQ